jgi:hypothetical protein
VATKIAAFPIRSFSSTKSSIVWMRAPMRGDA